MAVKPLPKPLQRTGRSVLLLLTAVMIFAGCHRDRFTISGNITGAAASDYLLLQEIKPGVLEPVDSLIPDTDGRFYFSSETSWPSYYMLSMGRENYMTLLVSPGEEVTVRAERNRLSKPVSVSGSAGTKIMTDYASRHDTLVSELSRLNKVYEDSINSLNLPFIMDSLDRRAATLVADFRTWALGFLKDNKSSMASIFILNQHIVPGMPLFNPAKEPELFYSVDSSLYAQYPESDLVIDFHAFAATLRNSGLAEEKEKGILMTGDTIPEIALPNPAGDTIFLSSKRGKVILVDFWAAWCPPCREENPNLVKMYDMYHRLGFDIYQVSLDLRNEDWTEAIRNDRLGRWTHVSDLRYRDSEVVKTFNITGIPFNILIDRDGRIIDINLRGVMLQKKLEEIFMQK